MAQGDRTALAALYDETAPVLYGLACRMLGDAGEAQEALCEVYARAWERVRSSSNELGQGAGGLLAWLILLTRTVALERRSQRAIRVTPDPELSASGGRTAAASVLERLGPAERRTIEAVFFEGAAGGKREEVRAAFSQLRSILHLQKGGAAQ